MESTKFELGSAIEVLISSGSTIAQLKLAALNKLPDCCKINHANKGFRLRRVIGQNKLGNLYLDESRTLASVDLEENDILIKLEHGCIPNSDQIEVAVSLKLSEEFHSDHCIILNLDATIKEMYVISFLYSL